jgi:RHS repeat-associated protein
MLDLGESHGPETSGGAQAGSTIRYLIDEQTPTGYPQIAEEVLVGTGVIRAYTYGTMRISQRLLITGNNWQLSYFGYDGGGSVRWLLDPTGTVTDAYAYDAFGNTVAQAGSTFNQFLYRGEQFDSMLGMYYLRARYYRPQRGRFLTADKYEGAEVGACDCANHNAWAAPAGTHHLFSYSNGDPVDIVDPTGRAELFEQSLVLGGSLPAYPGLVAASTAVVGVACGGPKDPRECFPRVASRRAFAHCDPSMADKGNN